MLHSKTPVWIPPPLAATPLRAKQNPRDLNNQRATFKAYKHKGLSINVAYTPIMSGCFLNEWIVWLSPADLKKEEQKKQAMLKSNPKFKVGFNYEKISFNLRDIKSYWLRFNVHWNN